MASVKPWRPPVVATGAMLLPIALLGMRRDKILNRVAAARKDGKDDEYGFGYARGWVDSDDGGKRRPQSEFILDRSMKERARYRDFELFDVCGGEGQFVRILRASGFQAADVGSMESPPDDAVVVIRSRRPSCEREVASLLPRHL